MEWHDEGLEVEEEGLKGWTMVHQGSEQPAGGRGRSAAEAEMRKHRLAGFPPLFKGEPEEQRLARADAAAACWEALAANINDTLAGTDAGVFRALLDFARQSHRPLGPDTCPELWSGCQRIPTALVLAGGVNSADHGRTFPSLADLLRQQGCYVALLKPEHFTRGPGETIGEVLRQFSGLADSRAEHFAALAAWYEEEAGSTAELAQQAQQADQQEQQQAKGAAGSKAEARLLRQRPAPVERAAEAALAAEQAANRRRPLVVVVEGTEGVEVQCLRDFILVASESHAEVPLTLCLGLTTTASTLLSLLPSEVIDRCMALHNFRLATGIERLERLVQNVLLGGSGRWTSLLFSPGIIGRLIDAFLNHYFSTGVIVQGFRVAAWEHFRSVPASFLAAAALEGRDGLEAALGNLDAATLAELNKALGGRSAAQLAHAVHEAQAAWSRWAVGLQWLILAADALGLQSIDFRPWKLLEEALRPGFAGAPLKKLLAQVDKELRIEGSKQLSAQAVGQLAAALRQHAEQVWGGAAAAAEQLEALAAVEAGKEEDGEEEDGPKGSEQREQQAQQAQQAELAAEAPAAKKQKRDVFHSKRSRNQALLQKAAHKTAKVQGSAAAAAATATVDKEAAPGARLAAWLGPALRTLLAEPPTKLPGAAAFTCKDIAALDCLTAEPRAALHLALTEPQHFLPGLPKDLGVAPGQEDASLTYRLFDQDPACANLADWYEAYAAVYASGAGAAPASAGKKRKAAVKGGKAGKGKGERSASADAAANIEEGAGKGSGGGGGASVSEAKALQRELAARFSQATAELQYVGLIKPAKRRRGDYVQRAVHMPATGL